MPNLSLQAYGNTDPQKLVKYYSGTDALATGYALCYDVAASGSALDKTALGNQVCKPATANLMAFAGVVAPESNGFTGPGWVTLIVPNGSRGCVYDAYCHSNATAFSTALGPTDGQYYLADFSDSTLNLNWPGLLAAETANTSSTSAVKKVFQNK